MGNPLNAKYRVREMNWGMQYEGIHDFCFKCDKYVHRGLACPVKKGEAAKEGSTGNSPK